LGVSDLTGRELAVLAERIEQEGTHDVEFDARNLASGVYVYRLQVDGVTVGARKALLIK
jgi:hypothetical protein